MDTTNSAEQTCTETENSEQPMLAITEDFAASLDALNETSYRHLLRVATLAENLMEFTARLSLEIANTADSELEDSDAENGVESSNKNSHEAPETQGAANLGDLQSLLNKQATNLRNTAEAQQASLGTQQNPQDLQSAAIAALSKAYENAVQAQENTDTIAQATLTQGIATLYSVDTASTAVATDNLLSLLTALKAVES